MPSPPTAEDLMQGILSSMEDMSKSLPTFTSLIYGDSGVGKTIFALRVAQEITPVDKKILYVDSARGWTSALNHPDIDTSRFVRIRYQNQTHLLTLTQALEKGRPELEHFDCIVLDEYSDMADQDLSAVTTHRANRDPSKDPDEPKLPDMGAVTERFKRINASLFKSDLSIITTAHVRLTKKNSDDLGPSFMPKLSEKIRQPMQLVAYLTADLKEGTNPGDDDYIRWAQVHPSRAVIAKSRISGLDVRVHPSILYTAIVEFVQGKREVIEEVEPVTLPDEKSENNVTETDEITIELEN